MLQTSSNYVVVAAGVLALVGIASVQRIQAGSTTLVEASAETPTAKYGSVEGSFISFERLKTRGSTSEKDIVVYLEASEPGNFSPPTAPIVVNQAKLQFDPHVLPILKGSTVGFSNGDSVKHNIFSSEDCCAMDVDVEAGESSTKTFEQAGVVSIICRVHPDMSMWVISLDNPWFTHFELEKVKVDGVSTYQSIYKLDQVPPGNYTLTYWNKKLSSQTFPVVVKAGEATAFDITIQAK